MSESDLLVIWLGHTDALTTILFGHFSMTSAFLAVGYLAGKAIPTRLASIAIGLYAVMALTLTGTAQRHGVAAISVRDKLASMDANWHSMISEPQFIFPIAMYTLVVSMAVISFVSIAYFLSARRA